MLNIHIHTNSGFCLWHSHSSLIYCVPRYKMSKKNFLCNTNVHWSNLFLQHILTANWVSFTLVIIINDGWVCKGNHHYVYEYGISFARFWNKYWSVHDKVSLVKMPDICSRKDNYYHVHGIEHQFCCINFEKI